VTMPPYEEKPDNSIDVQLSLAPLHPDVDVYVGHQLGVEFMADYGIRIVQECGALFVADWDDYSLAGPSGKVVAKISRQADAVTVSTPFLAEAYAKFNSNITVLPNYLDWGMWEDVEPQYEVERGGRVRVGWMGCLDWGFTDDHGYHPTAHPRYGDVGVLKGLIGPFLQRHPNVDFVAAGDPNVHDFLGIPEDRRVSYDRVPFRDMTLPSVTAVMDIGLVPLERSNFNEAKSCLKGMEYNACGIPYVATPTEQYRDWTDEGENGFLARRAHDWIRHLELLVNDDELRREMGRKARLKASERTIDEYAGQWEQVYGTLQPAEPVERRIGRAAISLGGIQKPGEIEPMVKLVRELAPAVVVEIGSAQGGTLFAWCKAAAPDALVVSIDLPGGDFGGIQGDTYGQRNYRRMAGYRREGQTLKFVQGNSQSEKTKEALLKVLDGRPIDFLFIDGDHAYEGVKRDYELYSPLVREGGLIGFHDVVNHPAEPLCQVDKFWNEIKDEVDAHELIDPNNYGYPRWGGIGTITVGGGRQVRGRRAVPEVAPRQRLEAA
jgi:glycosyltransferase involved in cell wall biosynthesis/cephalosporin hydroxylase